MLQNKIITKNRVRFGLWSPFTTSDLEMERACSEGNKKTRWRNKQL